MDWDDLQQSMPLRFFLYAEVYVSMGRNKPKLLPEKLEIIREHVGISKKDLASKLEVARKLKVTSRLVSDYEKGRCEPTLMEALLYARSVRVPMELIIDDMFSVDAFRRHLLRKQKRRTNPTKHNEH
jgi:DNA-binding XRE family transcriptional regulator